MGDFALVIEERFFIFSQLNDWSAHDDFAVMIANEVLSDPTSPFVNSLCRILTLLDLNPKQADNIRDLEILVANMMKVSNVSYFKVDVLASSM